jgi:iron complex transport system ATP-binding protein
VIRADHVTHAFGSHQVLHDVTLHADEGEVLGLVGPNGSGKSTLLRVLHRALVPDGGTAHVDHEPVADLNPRQLARRIAVVVQEREADPQLTVIDEVLLGRSPFLPVFRQAGRRDREIAENALERVGAGHLAAREVATLSGGERQRVLIARALTQEPRLLLMDEPTNHLDVHYQHEVLHLVRSLGITVVVVLHDLNLAARYCDRLLLVDDGQVRAAGTPEEVLVPEIVEPVYRVTAQRATTDDGCIQMLFRHRSARVGAGERSVSAPLPEQALSGGGAPIEFQANDAGREPAGPAKVGS